MCQMCNKFHSGIIIFNVHYTPYIISLGFFCCWARGILLRNSNAIYIVYFITFKCISLFRLWYTVYALPAKYRYCYKIICHKMGNWKISEHTSISLQNIAAIIFIYTQICKCSFSCCCFFFRAQTLSIITQNSFNRAKMLESNERRKKKHWLLIMIVADRPIELQPKTREKKIAFFFPKLKNQTVNLKHSWKETTKAIRSIKIHRKK